MDEQKKPGNNNVISMKDRKKSRNRSTLGKQNQRQKKKPRKQSQWGNYTIWQYVQLVMLIGACMYLMRLCSR